MKNNKCYDFADELPYKDEKDILIEEKNFNNLKIKKIEVKTNRFHKKGNYLSFEIKDLDEKELTNNKIKIISDYIKNLINKYSKNKPHHVLMVGLGNDDFSSDALGPETIKKINANSYLDDVSSKISCIIPGVMKTTGLESVSIIKSLVDKFHFDLVIVFDSLATRNIDRFFKVIQVTDTEIIPGSGIKNFRKSLNSKYLGVPLIAIGVSMAIMYQTIVENILSRIEYHKVNKINKDYFINQLNNDLILTSKDSELRVKNISLNLSKIFNYIFS